MATASLQPSGSEVEGRLAEVVAVVAIEGVNAALVEHNLTYVDGSRTQR